MRKLTRLCTCLLTLLLVINLGSPTFAAGSVTYDGSARKFIFAPGTEDSPTNLFENFQSVMPGDRLTEQLLIKNDTANNVKIKLYMRSLGAQENSDAFLSQLELSVKQQDDSLLFSAPADQTAQLTDWVYLGTIYSGGEILLDVTLNVPITLGNDFQDQIGYIDWEFKVEQLPVEPGDPKPPQTSDPANLQLYGGLMIVSLFSLVIVVILGKRKQKN